MKAYYSDVFTFPLPEQHRVQTRKYRLLRERIMEEGILPAENLIIPDAATSEQILRCHDRDYLERIQTGTLTHAEISRIGLTWSPELVERSQRSSGATIAAATTALIENVSANLAGGAHHAGRNYGAGFSVFNDVLIAARDVQTKKLVEKVAIIDCDVHQGNGTADIASNDPSIFTFSIHGENNYPLRKVAGDLDIGLANGTSDEKYLDLLMIAMERVLFFAQPDLVIYISGADPFFGDALGKLALTKAGLAHRDRLVLSMCRAEDIPVAVTMGGGYAKEVNDIVDIHLQTIKIATKFALT